MNKPKFKTNKEALNQLQAQVQQLELSTNRSFEDLCCEAEHSLEFTPLLSEVESLSQNIKTLKYLVNKEFYDFSLAS